MTSSREWGKTVSAVGIECCLHRKYICCLLDSALARPRGLIWKTERLLQRRRVISRQEAGPIIGGNENWARLHVSTQAHQPIDRVRWSSLGYVPREVAAPIPRARWR